MTLLDQLNILAKQQVNGIILYEEYVELSNQLLEHDLLPVNRALEQHGVRSFVSNGQVFAEDISTTTVEWVKLNRNEIYAWLGY